MSAAGVPHGAAVPDQSTAGRPGLLRRLIAVIGVDNLSLIIALVALVVLIANVSPALGVQGGQNFWGWQNLMNSLAQSIVIVGLLAVGETVVIVGGALDISVGSIASVASVFSAIVITQGILGRFGAGSMQFAILAGMAAGALCGVINGLVVTVLKVNPIIATLGTLAIFDGLAFLIAPDGKPVGVVTQPDFTWLSTGRFLADLPLPALGGRPWPGVPVVFVVLIVVVLVVHVLMRYTDIGRSIYAVGGNPTAARLAGIDLRRLRITMYVICGTIAGLAGVLLTARTTSGNPINGRGLELQAITAVFLGGAATAGGRGTVVGTFLAVLLVGVLSNGMNLVGVDPFYQRVALGVLLIGAVAVQQWRQSRAERARTRTAAAG
jgi:ribose transport system permease protein/L-arabinose transport system permease protein